MTHSYRHNVQVHVTSVRCDERIGDDLKVVLRKRNSCLCSCGFSCLVQASISSVVKSSDSRLDLGQLRIDDHGAIQIDPFYPDVRDTCKYGRMPPLTPDMVARKLQEEKQFTNDSDVSK